MGQPHKVEELGDTEVPEELFQEYLFDLGPKFGYVLYNDLLLSATIIIMRDL